MMSFSCVFFVLTPGNLIVLAYRICTVSGDNLFDWLGINQSNSRMLMKLTGAVMVSRLSLRLPNSSMCSLLHPIVETVVVEHIIAGNASHDNYNELRRASLDAEAVLMQKMHETLQKNLRNFRKDTRNLLVTIFDDKIENPSLKHVKYNVMGKPAGEAILDLHHPTIVADCFAPRTPTSTALA
jgi:hypothetical protein